MKPLTILTKKGILNPLMWGLCMYLLINWFPWDWGARNPGHAVFLHRSLEMRLFNETLNCQVVSLTSETGSNPLILILPGGDSSINTHIVYVDISWMINNFKYMLCLSKCCCFSLMCCTTHQPFTKKSSNTHLQYMSDSIIQMHKNTFIASFVLRLYM